jgi:hypothetical protein
MVQLTEVTDESVRRPNVGQEDDDGWENESEVVSSIAQFRCEMALGWPRISAGASSSGNRLDRLGPAWKLRCNRIQYWRLHSKEQTLGRSDLVPDRPSP